MTASTPTIVIAIRLRSSRLRAIAHGLPPIAARSPARTGASPAIAPPISLLLDPGLADEPIELLAEREVADPLRHEVDVLRREERRHRGGVRDFPVDLGPLLVRRGLVLECRLQGVLHLHVDLLVAEAGDIDARVAAGVERVAAEEDVEEVRRSRVVLVPLLDVDLHLVLRVLDVGEEDVAGDRLDARLVADLVEYALQVDADRLVDLVVRREDGDLLAGGA